MENNASEMVELRAKGAEKLEPKFSQTVISCDLRKRYIVTILTMIATFIACSIEANLNLVIKGMTTDLETIIENETYVEAAEFNWTTNEQNILVNAFSWGYMLSPLGGYLASRVGGANLYGVVIALSGVLTILTPLVVHFGIPVFFLARMLTGMLIGFSASASIDIFVHWAPPKERSRLTTCLCVAIYANIALNDSICNFIVNAFSWPVLFFQTGTVCLIWYFIWFMLICNDPSKDACISRAERLYLKENIAYTVDQVIHPWKKIFSSLPMWVFINARFIDACSFSFLYLYATDYCQGTFGVDPPYSSVLLAIDHISTILLLIATAVVVDSVRGKQYNLTQVHRIYVSLLHLLAIALFTFISLRKNFIETLFCLYFLRLCYCVVNVSYFTYAIDMASHCAGFVMGMSYTFTTLGLMLSKLIVTLIVPNHTLTEWNYYIFLLVILNALATVLFFFFSSGYPQPWTLSTRQSSFSRCPSTQRSSLVN